jgi:hypothetical protein
MSTSIELKTCKKGLHQYPADKKRCLECQAERKKQWETENSERRRELTRKWNANNRELRREMNRKWNANNKEQVRKAKNKWNIKNIDRNRELRRKRIAKNPELSRNQMRQWRAANPDKAAMQNAKRRATKRQAVATWGNENSIKKFYAKRAELTKLTGIEHHVDHIYPLKSDWLCGLHVENNLQILTETENTSKGNRTWPGQLDCQKGSVYAIFPKELTDLLND